MVPHIWWVAEMELIEPGLPSGLWLQISGLAETILLGLCLFILLLRPIGQAGVVASMSSPFLKPHARHHIS